MPTLGLQTSDISQTQNYLSCSSTQRIWASQASEKRWHAQLSKGRTVVWLHAELLMLNHWTILSCMAPWLCHFIFTWTATALIFTCPGLLSWWYRRYHRHEPLPTEARSLWYRPTSMHVHKGWNDGCTVNLRVLEWFMWLCDLNVNFCECLTAQVFREQMENKPTTWPHIYTCMGHEWSWNIYYCMIPTSAWAERVMDPQLPLSLWAITKGN